MVAHGLIFGVRVAGAEVEEIVVGGKVGSGQQQGDASVNTGQCGRRGRGDFGGYVDLDGAVAELRAVDEGEAVFDVGEGGEADGFAAAVVDCFGFQALGGEVLYVGLYVGERGLLRSACLGCEDKEEREGDRFCHAATVVGEGEGSKLPVTK